MKLISISINKKSIYYAILEKSIQSVSLLDSGQLIIPQNQKPTDLMECIHTLIDNLLQSKTVDKAIFVLPSSSANISTEVYISSIMPTGIAVLSCYNQGLDCAFLTMANVAPVKMGYPKNSKSSEILKDMDRKFPEMAYKNDNMRKVVLLGYRALL